MNEHDARLYSAGFFVGISREQPKTGESRRTLSDKISRYTLKKRRAVGKRTCQHRLDGLCDSIVIRSPPNSAMNALACAGSAKQNLT
jgi:hypothetical protein